MNWERLQTYGSSSEKSFEMICNQLFENWCRKEYGSSIKSFHVVNGSGGDGGVESYAELYDNTIVGLQAKWFRTSIDSSQICQIRNSLKTALKIRANITKYIICVPRDLASLTGKGNNTEAKRWNDFITNMTTEYPNVSIELWNDTRITSEMQKTTSGGIHKFWFENSEIELDRIEQTLKKAKKSWLSTKYVPDLNTSGQIRKQLINCLGSFEMHSLLANKITDILALCKQFDEASGDLTKVCGEKSTELHEVISDAQGEINALSIKCKKIHDWLINEYFDFSIDEIHFYTRFDLLAKRIKDCDLSLSYHFHFYDVTKVLNKLAEIDYNSLFNELEECINKKSILFLGDPGTGKTQGVAAFADELIEQQFHFPIIIQARSIPENYSWRDIILHTLGLADVWNENELWEGLISAVNRNRFKQDVIHNEVSLYPKILVIVDGIDEASSHQKWIDRIKETTTVTDKFPQIRFCFTSRPIVFSSEMPSTIKYASVKRLNSGGDVPVYKLFDSYIEKYDIRINNCQWLKYALNTPLALKLFCELHNGQEVSISRLSEVSMEQLWRKKIDKIQMEYNAKVNVSDRNQRVFISIVSISKHFVERSQIERDELIDIVNENINNREVAEKLLDHLEAYGIIGSYLNKGSGLSPDRYIYYPGIQGYFDYASAIYLLELYKHPSKINFEKHGNVNKNMLYSLAVISIQKYNYLLTHNSSINKVLFHDAFIELQFYALQHSDFKTANQYKKQILDIMRGGADALSIVTNKLILPLARIDNHPLGVSLLDDYLNEFDKPAIRDIVWSLPAYLEKSRGHKWYKSTPIDILDEENEEYILNPDDLHDGLPIIYAWTLSNVSNPARKFCRDRLMKWAKKAPYEYFKLFLHFSDVNDPQIRSDLFSILMCLVYDGIDECLIKEISDWVLLNILSTSKIDQNRDISIRYYSIAIIERAKVIGIYSIEEVKEYLPPYHLNNVEIELNKDALAGTRMGGYSAITYDLARYVLVDHFDYGFNNWHYKQMDKLIKQFTEKDNDYSDITSEQFIISAVYAFVLSMGWNEDEFYNHNVDESGHYKESVDYSISGTYYSADHGAQSSVMTVCEKYVWAARNNLSGFLSDRLLYGDEQIQITDYNLLDDFFIPVQEIKQIDPDNIPNDRPWYIPEPESVLCEKSFISYEEIIQYIKEAPDIRFEKWIKVDNSKQLYSILCPDLLALKMYACFYEPAGIDTSLFINSIILKSDELPDLISKLHEKETFKKVCNPTDWNGGVETSCYITPEEVCWFPWKKHYDSYNTEEFPGFDIHSAVDECVYNYPEFGDVSYHMPSAMIRKSLGIIDTDGYLYLNKNKDIMAEYSVSGEKLRTCQEIVLVDADNILQKLKENGQTIIWIMQELRRETLNAQEKYGKFFAEKRQYYIGYYNNDEFIVEKLESMFSSDKQIN